MKFVESYSIEEYEILTDTGWQDVTHIYKTIPFKVWKVTLENGMYLECADDHLVFINGKEIFVRELTIGDALDTILGSSNVVEILQFEHEENMYDVTVPNGERFYSNGILSHNTQTTGAYVLWYSQFHADKFIGIASNKSSSAKDYLNRIKIMYEELPWWLKSGVKEYNKNSIEFENGTRVETAGTTEDTFRGRSCVPGYTQVIISNDKCIHNISINDAIDLMNEEPDLNWQIYTQDGYKNFDGFISQGFVNQLFRFHLIDGRTIDCTFAHRFLMKNGKYEYAYNIKPNDGFVINS